MVVIRSTYIEIAGIVVAAAAPLLENLRDTEFPVLRFVCHMAAPIKSIFALFSSHHSMTFIKSSIH